MSNQYLHGSTHAASKPAVPKAAVSNAAVPSSAEGSAGHGRRCGVTAAIGILLLLGTGGGALAAPGASGAVASPALPAAASQAPEWAKGRLLAVPRAGLADAEMASVLRPHGGRARRLGNSNIHIVELPAGASETAALQVLARHPHLKHVELDRRVSAGLVENDPYAGSEWHLAKIGAGAAWDVSQGAGVTIAILDTGVAASHPDLAGKIVPGWNFFDNNADTADVHGHGTAVAGAAAAATNNGIGVSSVAGAANIMPVRIADANGYAYWSTVAQGLTYAADHGARVANISFVGVAGSAAVQNAAQYMRSKGGLVVVCAGNNGIDEGIVPTSTMISVSATDGSDQRTNWSSYGAFVTLSAPGAGIWTTSRSGGYEAWSGTSFSSPLAAGVVALMMSARPAMPNAQVESLLYSSAVDLGTAGRDPYYGHGRLNAAGAVNAVITTPGADVQPPVAAITSPSGSSSVSSTALVDVAASDNVGVVRVELRVNGATVATDTSAPFQFGWDTTPLANGSASLVAYAFDAAGNASASSPVVVNVANAVVPVTPPVVSPVAPPVAPVADTTPPAVRITNPAAGRVSGNVQVKVSASDDAGSAGITQTLYIDGNRVASSAGASLAYTWNTRKATAGSHTLQAVARDAAGNASTVSLAVTR